MSVRVVNLMGQYRVSGHHEAGDSTPSACQNVPDSRVFGRFSDKTGLARTVSGRG